MAYLHFLRIPVLGEALETGIAVSASEAGPGTRGRFYEQAGTTRGSKTAISVGSADHPARKVVPLRA